MDRSEVAPTLLNALLHNQQVIICALRDIAQWAEREGDDTAAKAVSERLQAIESSQALVGNCVRLLMR